MCVCVHDRASESDNPQALARLRQFLCVCACESGGEEGGGVVGVTVREVTTVRGSVTQTIGAIEGISVVVNRLYLPRTHARTHSRKNGGEAS